MGVKKDLKKLTERVETLELHLGIPKPKPDVQEPVALPKK